MTRAPNAAIIVSSDWHKGSILAHWPEELLLPNGSKWTNNAVQIWLKERWIEFWDYAREIVVGRRTIVVINGDLVEGVHHYPSELVTLNREWHRQAAIAEIGGVKQTDDIWLISRGTSVHDGPEGEDAEAIAKVIGCPKTSQGTCSQQVIKINVNGIKLFFAHYIGITRSPVAETTALTTNLIKLSRNAGMFEQSMFDIICLAHRHRASSVWLPGKGQGFTVFTTPSWVARGEYVSNIEPTSVPQVGGTVILIDKDGSYNIKHKNWTLPEKQEEVVEL